MAEYFAGGHLRFVNGEWRDDNGDVVEISRVRHGRWKKHRICVVWMVISMIIDAHFVIHWLKKACITTMTD